MSGDRHFLVQVQRSANGVEPGYWVIEIESEASSAPTVFMHAWRSIPSENSAAAEFIPLDPMMARLTPEFPPFTARLPSSSVPKGVASPSPQDALRPAVSLPDPLFPTVRSYVRDPRPEEWIQCTISGTASAQKPVAVGAYDAEKTPPHMTNFSAQGPDARALAAGLHKGDPKPDIAAPGESIDTVFFRTGSAPILFPQSGTSFATPHVTGVLALMWAANPNLTNVQLKDRLLAAARKHPPKDPRLTAQTGGWLTHNPNVQKELWGAGMLDALDAAKEALKP
jgi:subtilisin family serine protease